MVKHSVYRQLCTVLLLVLLVFGSFVGILWSRFSSETSRQVSEKTTGLLYLLMPPANASVESQQATVAEICEAASVEVLLLDAAGSVIAETGGEHAEFDVETLSESAWSEVRSEKQWATLLPDGRALSVVPTGLRLVNEPRGIFVTVLVLGLVVGLVAYPVIKSVTQRIEQLQGEVERIGMGELHARAQVQGQDEITQLARSFNAAAERIESLVKGQRMMLAHASHELRTPLARIRVGLELLAGVVPNRARVDEMQEDIAELDNLIGEILVLSRLVAEPDPDATERIDVVAIAAEESARFDDCTLEGRNALAIWGDPAVFRRMIRNLIENAFKHGAAPVQVTVEESGGWAEIRVADSGPGVPAEERERIWEPFRRPEGSASKPGYGLGLAIVSQAALSLGGTSIVDNAESSTFVVRIPLERATSSFD
ncbi:MAG: HAMP domain-containing sensor histidine kinase [Planctomycetota bacterium]